MLQPTRLGLAAGILWGLSVFVLTIISINTGYAALWLALLSDVYPGYELSYIGSVIGLIYGFVDAFVCLFLLAWIYNKLGCKSCCS